MKAQARTVFVNMRMISTPWLGGTLNIEERRERDRERENTSRHGKKQDSSPVHTRADLAR